MIKILSLPSYHPYTSKLKSKKIKISNPNHNSFQDPNLNDLKKFTKVFPPESYDIVHFHFEYYLIKLKKLRALLNYFKSENKKIIWTWHDRTSLLENDLTYDSSYEKLLFEYSDQIITFSKAMKNWISNNFGQHSRPVMVLPMGYLAHPKLVQKAKKVVAKKQNLFSLLVGDFRKSKNYTQATKDFIEWDKTKSMELQIIYRSNDPLSNLNLTQKNQLLLMIKNQPNITVVKKPDFSDFEMCKLFYASHAVILPYNWGTHSGQIELAKDCGCYAVVSDVGYYREQWSKIIEYKVGDGEQKLSTARYVSALSKAKNMPPLMPYGHKRVAEHNLIISKHQEIYQRILK